MEKSLSSEKSGSFPRFGRRRNRVDLGTVSFKFEGVNAEDCDEDQNPDESGLDSNHDQIMEQVHLFIEKLASDQGKSKAPEIPKFVDPFLKMIESMISTYEQREPSAKFGQNQDEDTSFFEAVSCLSKIINNLDEFPFDSATTYCFNRAGSIQHRAMLLSEHEFLALLDISKRNCNNSVNIIDSKTPKTANQSLFGEETDESKAEIEFPYLQPESIANMNRLTTAMISAGYDAECCMVYGDHRLKALDAEFTKQDYENVNMDDLERMDWESLEGEIDNWIYIVKYCITNLFSVERKLCDSIFEHHSSISQRSFYDLVTSLTTRLLSFPNALVMIKQYSAEKLFKFLDVHETLRDLVSSIGNHSVPQNLISEISVTQCRINKAAVSIFCQLENSIKSDNGKIPVASGTVHPLTRYTMNYLKYACEYNDTLEQVFKQRRNETKGSIEDQETKSPFAVKLMMVTDLLDSNIEMKSQLYKDPALRYIFLMNNGRYILQKIKGSNDIYEMIGQSWSRKRTSDLRQYHKNYQRETWSKLLQCISHEGLQVNGKVSKTILKERFKKFNSLFDEIHKTQSSWMVSDEQLKSELRVSISAVVIPAYRSFLGRFKPHFDSSKKAEKYIKYQPEDIEGLIDQLFEGNVASMGRRRHHNSH